MTGERVVSAATRRRERQREHRRHTRRRWGGRLLRTVAVGGPLALLVWLAVATPVLAVRTVAVRGTERLTAAQVQAALAVPRGTPLLRVDTAAAERRVRALPAVRAVRVSRAFPGTLRVQVTERVAVAGLLDRGGATLLDASGVPFARARALPAGVVRLQVPRPGPDDPTTRAALQVVDQLPPTLRSPLRIVRATSPAGVTLVLSGGRQVVWGAPEQAELKARVTVALLRLPGRVFDVSRPSVVTRR